MTRPLIVWIVPEREQSSLFHDHESIFEMNLGCLEVSTKRVQADEYNAGDESDAEGCHILAGEMRLEMIDCFDILLQRETLLLVQDNVRFPLSWRFVASSPVNRAQGEYSVQDCRFA